MTVPSATRPASSTPNTTPKPTTPAKPAYLRKGDGGSPRVPGRPATPTPGALSSKNVQHPYTPTRKELSDIFYKTICLELSQPEEVVKLQTASEIEVRAWLQKHYGGGASASTLDGQEARENEECEKLRKTVTELQETCAANQAALDAAQSEVTQKTEELRAIEDQTTALKEKLEETQGQSEDFSDALNQLTAKNAEQAKKIEELRELEDKFKQFKIAVLELSAEVGKLMPREGSSTAQISTDFIHQTILNCISQVNELKRKLGLEVEEEVSLPAQEPLPDIQVLFLQTLNELQSRVERGNSEFETKFKTISVSRKEDDTPELTQACHEQIKELLRFATEASKLKYTLCEIITALQAKIEAGKTPDFTPEFLKGIETVTGWYAREQQENDIVKHLQEQQRKLDNLSEILTRWNKIDETLNSQLFSIELKLSNEMTEEITDDLSRIKIVISSLRIPELIITEETIRDKLLLEEYDRFSVGIRSFPTYLRDCRKSFNDVKIPAEGHLKDIFIKKRQQWHNYQKRVLKEHYDRFVLLTPKINRLIQKLQKEVEVGKFDEKVPPIYLERLAICTGQTVDTIVDMNIKPFEQAHLQRVSKLNDLVAKQQKNLEAAELAKKEINRSYDALMNGGTYRYETTFNALGWADPEVEKIFPSSTKFSSNTGGELMPGGSPQVSGSLAASSSN